MKVVGETYFNKKYTPMNDTIIQLPNGDFEVLHYFTFVGKETIETHHKESTTIMKKYPDEFCGFTNKIIRGETYNIYGKMIARWFKKSETI